MRAVVALTIVALLATTGCAGVYLNDPDLAKQADTADTQVQGADTLKPYADQLANLQTVSALQDVAVANRDVATRDAIVTPLLAGDGPTELKALDDDACARLAELTGWPTSPCDDRQEMLGLLYFSDQIAVQSRLIDEDQATVDATRAAYERVRVKDDPDKDDCDSVLSPGFSIPHDQGGAQLLGLQDDCEALTKAKAGMSPLVGELRLAPLSPLKVAYAAAEPAHPPSQTTSPKEDAALQKEIDQAAELAKEGDVAKLASFQSDIEEILKDSSSVAQIAGLTKVQQQLGDVLTGTLCSPPPSSGVDCASLADASTAGRASAVWSLLQAIAQGLDAKDPRLRSASWLAAANAILAAEKSNAQIQADAEAAASASAKARFVYLSRAAFGFASVDWLVKSPNCPPGPNGTCAKFACVGADVASCGMADYLDAWNSGLAPADILAYRETLIFAQASIKKQQAAQAEQQSLGRAASASLKAYADGGLQPSAIAQLIVDAGLLGVAAAK